MLMVLLFIALLIGFLYWRHPEFFGTSWFDSSGSGVIVDPKGDQKILLETTRGEHVYGWLHKKKDPFGEEEILYTYYLGSYHRLEPLNSDGIGRGEGIAPIILRWKLV